MDELWTKVRPVLSSAFKVPEEQIQMSSRLQEDLHADSLDASVAVMELEELFQIEVPQGKRDYRTVTDILQHIDELMKAKVG